MLWVNVRQFDNYMASLLTVLNGLVRLVMESGSILYGNVVLYVSKQKRFVLLIPALKSMKVVNGRTLTTHVILGSVGKMDSFLASLLIVQNKWECRVMVSGC